MRSIIIPAWNEESVLGNTLTSLFHLDYPKERCEIIVVAGGTDATYEIAKSFSKKMRGFKRYVVLKQGSAGKNAAIQQGLKIMSASSDLIILLDADSIVDKEMLKMVDHILEKEGHQVANGDYYPVRGINYISVFYMFEKNRHKLIENTHGLYGGGGIFLKKNVIERVGVSDLFDPNVYIGVDYYLTKKLLERGYKIGYLKGAKIYTYLPSTFWEFVGSETRWLKTWINLSRDEAGFISHILKSFIVTVSFFSFTAIMFKSLNYAFLTGVPFLLFSARTAYDGLRVYSFSGEKSYMKYLWAYMLLRLIFEFLKTYSFIDAVILGRKPKKHFKGPRPG